MSCTTDSLEELRERLAEEQVRLELAEVQIRQQLLESHQSLSEQAVDPREAAWDDDGMPWLTVSGDHRHGACLRSEAELDLVRSACRELLMHNEFALSGQENRINYLVGSGHRYGFSPRDAEEVELARAAEQVVEDFLHHQQWNQRQQEIVRRMDRDGEVFLRFFPVSEAEGFLAVRFVEPELIRQPTDRSQDAASTWGIVTEPNDVEQVQGYYIDEEFVAANSIQHRKANVDRNTKRGLPTFYPVLSNLRRIEKLMRNMSVLAQTQAAIAVIRKHEQSSAQAIRQFADRQANLKTPSSAADFSRRYRHLEPGTILDAPAGIDYQFPTLGLDASRLIAILQAELRAVASRLVMPEFMLTADASNSNYASTLVAEGPAVKMFQRLQQTLIRDDRSVFLRLLQRAAEAGRLPHDTWQRLHFQIEPPSLIVRDQFEEARANAIKAEHGVLSRSTWQLQAGLDPEQEARNMGREGRRARDEGREK
ncbi:Bacteriophage capsid protein [Planctomycetales bacterium 10988]|nr:Bacteriophage capsid protein [Planctomycetales bacterium 10988]